MKIILLTALLLAPLSATAEIIRADYEGFTLWLDCDRRGAVKFRYNSQRDQGNYQRLKRFYTDPDIPARCQQTSTGTYKAPQQRYDRGHLVPANHLDFDKMAIRQSNYMTNILPQAAGMNRGAWLLTEEITECYRDTEELLIIGGPIYGDDKTNDYFTASHAIATPDKFWKVIIRGNDVIAWIVPNTQEAKRKALDRYLVSVSEIERRTGEKIPVDEGLKGRIPERSWPLPKGCDKS